MIASEHAVVVVIDVQGKLAGMMSDPDYLPRIRALLKGARFLGLPVILTEQAPQKIGTIIDAVRNLAPTVTPIAKETFSCYAEPAFVQELKRIGRKQVIVAGIEAHVCVFQTVRDLVKAGYEVYLVADAISARNPVDQEIGIHRAQKEGAILTTLEMTLTEILQSTRHPNFKDVMALLKENK
jgi:nicotinamidase-related amidase